MIHPFPRGYGSMVSCIPHVVRFRIELKWLRGLLGLGGVGIKPVKRFRFWGLAGLVLYLFVTTLNPGEDQDKTGFSCFQKRPWDEREMRRTKRGFLEC